VRQRVDFKIITLVHRSLSGHLPSYLADDCRLVTDARARLPTLEHWPSVALRAPSATEHLLLRHRGCGTVCHLICGNLDCHMDNLGVH